MSLPLPQLAPRPAPAPRSLSLAGCIERLWSVHWPAEARPGRDLAPLRQAGVVLDTCQRQLAFGLEPRPVAAPDDRGELLTGLAAYQLLLEVASGLRSAVPGETNVFGQFRKAWQSAERCLAPAVAGELRPLVHAVHADTRTIRQQYLVGVAGGSYGSLVRTLLAPEAGARILFIGTGDLARSMVPLFRSWEIGAWNHRVDHRPGGALAGVGRRFAPDDAAAAAAWATHAIFTTPGEECHDCGWRQRLAGQQVRALVHLGLRGMRRWPGIGACFDLDDVFRLAGRRNELRARQLALAHAACGHLARSRAAVTEAGRRAAARVRA